jgi:hypothetical protein
LLPLSKSSQKAEQLRHACLVNFCSPGCRDFGYLDPVASGFDVAIIRNDVIAELYTVIIK